jgi:hypothetical protein
VVDYIINVETSSNIDTPKLLTKGTHCKLGSGLKKKKAIKLFVLI